MTKRASHLFMLASIKTRDPFILTLGHAKNDSDRHNTRSHIRFFYLITSHSSIFF